MSYQQKYLKYKKKYIDLKNQLGAAAADAAAEAKETAFEALISKEKDDENFIEQFWKLWKKLKNNTTKSSLKQSIVGLLFYRKVVHSTFKLDEDLKKYGIILGQEIKEGYLTDGDYLAINEEQRKEDGWEYDVNLVGLTKKGRDKFLEEYGNYYPKKLNEIIGDKTPSEWIEAIENEIKNPTQEKGRKLTKEEEEEEKKEEVQPEGLTDEEIEEIHKQFNRARGDWYDKD